jgi:hypothetical protein
VERSCVEFDVLFVVRDRGGLRARSAGSALVKAVGWRAVEEHDLHRVTRASEEDEEHRGRRLEADALTRA